MSAVWKGDTLLKLESWRSPDTMRSADMLVELLLANLCGNRDSFGNPVPPGSNQRFDLVIDLPGLGAAIHDRMIQKGYRVQGFEGGKPAQDSVRFANARAEVFWALRTGLENAVTALPDDDRLWTELFAIRWREDSTGRTALEPKPQTSARLGHSPDFADAAALKFAAVNVSTGMMADVNW